MRAWKKAALHKAQSDHRVAVAALKKLVLDALAAQAAGSKKAGHKDAVNAIEAERDEFESDGTPPFTAPESMAQYQRGLKATFERLEKAFKQASKPMFAPSGRDIGSTIARRGRTVH